MIAVAEAMALPNVKLSPEASGVSSVGALPEPSAAEFQFAGVNQFRSPPSPVQYQVVALADNAVHAAIAETVPFYDRLTLSF